MFALVLGTRSRGRNAHILGRKTDRDGKRQFLPLESAFAASHCGRARLHRTGSVGPKQRSSFQDTCISGARARSRTKR